MPRDALNTLRLPAALLLLVIVVFVLLPRGEEDAATGTPAPSVIVGEVGGEVVTQAPSPTPTASQPTPTPTPTPEPTPADTPEATDEPTDEPTSEPTRPPDPDDEFTADVLVCRSISGSECDREVRTLPPNASNFTALVRFTDANAGDTMNAVVTGPSGTISGGSFALQGGGDGYYYSTFNAPGLEPGEYVVTATRNGNEVAVTTFRKAGG